MMYLKDKREVMAFLEKNPNAKKSDIIMCCNLGRNVVDRIIIELGY